MGIQASAILIPLFLLMLLGWSLMWIASSICHLTCVPVESWSINLTLLQIGICPILLACSETTVRENCMSLSCSFILYTLFCWYTLCHIHMGSCKWHLLVLMVHTKWDLSVVSDLKMVHMPWCCRQQQKTSNTPSM